MSGNLDRHHALREALERAAFMLSCKRPPMEVHDFLLQRVTDVAADLAPVADKASPVVYAMKRDKKTMAHVVTLPNGRCVVSWPTSTIIYDSEQSARDVHIRHMGGRGEATTFEVEIASKSFMNGWTTCYQDRCEGCQDAAGPRAPHYIPESDRADYSAGYLAMAKCMYGEDYQADESKWQGAKR